MFYNDKTAIRSRLLNALYKPAERYLEYRAYALIKRNNQLHNDPHKYGRAYYKGKLYASTFQHMGYGGHEVHAELEDEFEKLSSDKEKLITEKSKVTIALSWLLSECKDESILKNVIGNSLWNLLNINYPILEEANIAHINSLSNKFKTTIELMQQRQVDNMLSARLYGEMND